MLAEEIWNENSVVPPTLVVRVDMLALVAKESEGIVTMPCVEA